MFKKIMFATSATPACDHAARVAFNMAKRYGAHIDVFHVLGVPTRGFSQVVLDVKTKEKVVLDDEYQAWVKEEVKTYYTNQLKDALSAEIHVVIGVPHREILRYIRNAEPDLIVMGGSTGQDEESVYKQSMTGSTLQRVAKASPVPVLVVSRPAASFWGEISNVVFGTDFSKASDAAFKFALKVAREVDGDLHLFHALDISALHMGRILTQDEIESKIRDARQLIRGRYVPQMEGFKKFAIEVWEGLPYIEIVKYAREKQADLIVLAHHSQKRDEKDTRLGSNVEQVILRASCPVISINR
jgi:nucleotide-binding universal stress UspA family protein